MPALTALNSSESRVRVKAAAVISRSRYSSMSRLTNFGTRVPSRRTKTLSRAARNRLARRSSRTETLSLKARELI